VSSQEFSRLPSLPESAAARIRPILEEFVDGWKSGQAPDFVALLDGWHGEDRLYLLRELLRVECEFRRGRGEQPAAEEYVAQLAQRGTLTPAEEALIRAVFQEPLARPSHQLDTDLQSADSSVAPGKQRSSSQVDEDFQDLSTLDSPVSPAPGGTPSAAGLPESIGRYRIECELGRGGFGVVYKALDSELERAVAIKVPLPEKLPDRDKSPGRYEQVVQQYLDEARKVARLRHPGIVAVFDSGRLANGAWYIVYDFIAGTDLRTHLKQGRLHHRQAAEWVAAVAEAMHHAHQRGLVHRDIKPENILIDTAGKPHVADFGLALKDEDFGRDFGGGTPAYMSPEQVRGEGHRVDGRTDIFSLGVVFYELLTGQRPFRGDTPGELHEQIASVEAKPPRMIDDTIPKELQRICLKALSKRATDRYPSADEMADDLQEFLAVGPASRLPQPLARGSYEPAAGAAPEMTPDDVGPKDAFLSHASQDRAAAESLCRHLEQRGIRCWIAPRDVPLGADYGAAIIRAIEAAPVTVLLLSRHANNSVHVLHEVERAASKRKRLVPVRLEDVQPSESLELFLSSRQWLDAWALSTEQAAARLAAALRREMPPLAAPRPSPLLGPQIASDSMPPKIVPKGLRSFDASDKDFFLELLPGPHDRNGLPEGLRFWKTKVEQTDADETFAVGLIYGPSGCGKSSLVKAGLLPRLAEHVTVVYVEATADDTEFRLLAGIRKRCPALRTGVNLTESFTSLRRGQVLAPVQKLLIVLDQFEQWLHAAKEDERAELVQALRQCDGGRVQCIVMVRDDFWMAATRFMRALENPAARRTQQRPGRPVRQAARAQGAGGFWPRLRRAPRSDARIEQGPEPVPGPGRGRFGRGRQSGLRPLSAVFRHGEEQAVGAGHAARDGRHGRCRRDVSGGNLQRQDGPAGTSPAPKGRPRVVESLIARARHGYQETPAFARHIARSVRLREPPAGLRRPDPHPRQ
jgi:serine/threonine protein kinase